jgi:hypothetical protein
MFMEGIEEVKQLDDRNLHWRASIAGRDKEWDAEIQEQVPDEKIIWRSTGGATNAGMVTFREYDPGRTTIHLEMSYEPDDFIEDIGTSLGIPQRRIEGDLKRFREFLEERGRETGGWRGELENPTAPGGHTQGVGKTGETPARRTLSTGGNFATSPAGAVGMGNAAAEANRMTTDMPEPAGITQTDGRNITREKIEEGASASGQSLREQDRMIANAAGLSTSQVADSPDSSVGRTRDSEARTPESAGAYEARGDLGRVETSGSSVQGISGGTGDEVRWGPAAWENLRNAVAVRWPAVSADSLARVQPSRTALVDELAHRMPMDRTAIEHEVDMLAGEYAVEGARSDAGVVVDPLPGSAERGDTGMRRAG